MTTLTDRDSILEQLAHGNKLTSYKRTIIIDLQHNTKVEQYQATVDKLIIPHGGGEADEEMAQMWLDRYTPDYTTIQVKGRGGMLATLPYSQKGMLNRIVSIFNH